jgi:hypothetical protein
MNERTDKIIGLVLVFLLSAYCAGIVTLTLIMQLNWAAIFKFGFETLVFVSLCVIVGSIALSCVFLVLYLFVGVLIPAVKKYGDKLFLVTSETVEKRKNRY